MKYQKKEDFKIVRVDYTTGSPYDPAGYFVGIKLKGREGVLYQIFIPENLDRER